MSGEAMRTFDVHHHVGSLRDVTYDRPVADMARGHVETLDRNDIDCGAVMPAPAYPNPNGIADTREKNDDIARIKRDFEARFPVAFGTVEPWYGEPGLEEVDRCIDDLGLDGMMWHNRWQRMEVDGEMMQRLVGRVIENDGVVVLHAYSESDLTSPWRVLKVAESFPEGEFVVLDTFSSIIQTDMIPKLSDNFDVDNVWFDISLPHNLSRQIGPMKDAFGAEKLIFGTDTYTERDDPLTALPVEQFEAADLTVAERRAILWENAAALFELD